MWEEEETVEPTPSGPSNGYTNGTSYSDGGSSRGRGGGVRFGRGGGRGGFTCRNCNEEGHKASDCPSGGGRSNTACFKCGEEGHMSRECPTGGSGSSNKGCFKCGEEGHMSRDCPTGGSGSSNKGCFKCGEEGHMSRDCPNGGGDSGGGRSNACYKCGESGHMARDCTSEGTTNSSRPKGCFNCGEEGHQKADCTNPPKPREGDDALGPDGKPRPPIYVPEHISDEQLFMEGVNAGINFDNYDSIPMSVSGSGEIPPRIEQFKESGLRELLIANVEKAGYKHPTPIQRHCIPTIMAGRDIMGSAQTGSGKTAAFLLPILHKLLETGADNNANGSCAEPSAVIVAPTRELAIQIHNEARKFAMHSILRVVVCYGGASSASQYRSLASGCAVLVATPGRLMDFLDKGRVSFSSVKFLVLDEADRMLDMGFIGDIEKLIKHPTMPGITDRQTLLFSATFPEEIQSLAAKYMNDYLFFVMGSVGAANTDVTQEVVNVPRADKRHVLLDKLKDIISQDSNNKILVFVETKRMADFLACYLSSQDLSSTSIHGDRFQSQREEALAQFKNGIRNILVATAVAARGLDIKGVSHVINYDLPKEVDEYVHRIGRTGRVGNRGYALSFYDQENDSPLAKNLVRVLQDAQQTVESWLQDAAATSGHSQTYHGAGNFASSDIRGQNASEGSSYAFGGPDAAVEEEVWD